MRTSWRRPGPPGAIICNPPYGERIGEEKDLAGLYELLGNVFRRAVCRLEAFVFTGNPRLARAIGLRPAAEVPLFNGKIPCRLLRVECAGSTARPHFIGRCPQGMGM